MWGERGVRTYGRKGSGKSSAEPRRAALAVATNAARCAEEGEWETSELGLGGGSSSSARAACALDTTGEEATSRSAASTKAQRRFSDEGSDDASDAELGKRGAPFRRGERSRGERCLEAEPRCGARRGDSLEQQVARVVQRGAREDAQWLGAALSRQTFLGFGRGVAARVPSAWRRARRVRVIAWCEDLGFRSVASGESTVLEIESRRVAPLRSALAALCEDAFERAAPSPSVPAPTARDRDAHLAAVVPSRDDAAARDAAAADDAAARDTACADEAPCDDVEACSKRLERMSLPCAASAEEEEENVVEHVLTRAAAAAAAAAVAACCEEEAADDAAAACVACDAADGAVAYACDEEAAVADEHVLTRAAAAVAAAAAAREEEASCEDSEGEACSMDAATLRESIESIESIESAPNSPGCAWSASLTLAKARLLELAPDPDEEPEPELARRRRKTLQSARRRSLVAGRVKNVDQSPPQRSARRRAVAAAEAVPARCGLDGRRELVGAWLAGERRDGRAVVDHVGWVETGRCVVVDVLVREGSVAAVVAALRGIPRRLEVALGSVREVEERSARAWPRGAIVRGFQDEVLYVGETLLAARLPQLAMSPLPELFASQVEHALAFTGCGRDAANAACACWGWCRAALAQAARSLGAIATGTGGAQRRSWAAVRGALPKANFLSDGAFKRVYRCVNEHGEMEAVSVADLALLGDDASAAREAARELEITFLLSRLAQRVGPHFVTVHEAFECDRAPAPSCWDEGLPIKKGQRKPRLGAAGRYLYARMGLCSLGDLESWLRKVPGGVLPLDATRCVLFQMCVALHAARARHALRHYDVKLLNFLASPVESGQTVARYSCGGLDFRLELEGPFGVWAKLADFGTSHVGLQQLGARARGAAFATFENAAIELLTHGDASDRHAFAPDTFALGLCALHLYTGDAPYEEVLAEARAPVALRRALHALWLAPKKTTGSVSADDAAQPPSFETLARVLRDCSAVADDEQDDPDSSEDEEADLHTVTPGLRLRIDRTLVDSFYRFVVLLGLPSEEDPFFAESAAWRAARRALAGPPEVRFVSFGKDHSHEVAEPLALKRRGRAKPPIPPEVNAEEVCRRQFAKDSERFSLAHGDEPRIARARERLSRTPGGEAALRGMLHFDPARRPTMRALLASPVFEPLRETHVATALFQEPDV